MEFLSQFWVLIASIIGSVSLTTILVFVLKIGVGSQVKRFLSKINVEKIADKATEKGIQRVKKVSFTHSIQPLVESGLERVNEKSNQYIDAAIKRMEDKLDSIILIQEKQAAYFDNSIGVSETAKQELRDAISEAKNEFVAVESTIVDEVVSKKENEPTIDKNAPINTIKVER